VLQRRVERVWWWAQLTSINVSVHQDGKKPKEGAQPKQTVAIVPELSYVEAMPETVSTRDG